MKAGHLSALGYWGWVGLLIFVLSTRKSDYGEGWLYWAARKIHGMKKSLGPHV